MKARSRLSSSTPDSPHEPQRRASLIKKPMLSEGKKQAYLKHLTWLISAIFGYLLVGGILLTVHPADIANIIFANSFLLFQVVFLISTFFLASWLWLNSRRGMLTAVYVQVVMSLYLQSVQLTWLLCLGILASFVIMEFLITSMHRYANFRQTPHHRVRTSHRTPARRSTG